MNPCSSANADLIEGLGCQIDHEAIVDELGAGFEGASEVAVEAAWLEMTLALFEPETVTVYRHLTVANPEAFAQAVMAGAPAGAHWSVRADIRSPYPHQSDRDVLVAATLRTSQLDVTATLRNFFACPWEMEPSFEGRLDLLSITEVGTGRLWKPDVPIELDASHAEASSVSGTRFP